MSEHLEQFNSREQYRELSRKDLMEACRAISTYNKKRTKSIFVTALPKEVTLENQLENLKTDVTYEEIELIHKTNLEKIGLTVLANNNNQDDDPSWAYISVQDIPLFLSYCNQNLDEYNLSPELITALNNICASLNMEIRGLAKKSKKHDISLLIDRMSGVDNLIEEYKRLDPDNTYGLLDSIKITETYKSYFDTNSFYEHQIIDEYYLLAPNSDYRNWFSMPLPETLETSMEKMLDGLEKIKERPELLNQALKNVKQIVEFAIKGYSKSDERNTRKSYLERSEDELERNEINKNCDTYLEILEKISRKIEKIESSMVK